MRRIISVFAAMLAIFAAVAQDNIELGKKYYDAERYDQALPYLQKAVAAGDADSKARLATMIFGMQVPSYSMDRDKALAMFDEAIEQGSVYAIERKGFCTLLMGDDTKEAKMAGIELLKEASEKGSGDASAELYEFYRDGIQSFASGEDYLPANDSIAMAYLQKACDQDNLTGKAYIGMYTYNGTNGYEKDEIFGVQMLEEALAMSERFFTTDCLEPAKCLCGYYRANGMVDKAKPIEALLKRYHPTEYK